jgi:hypothetical protein
MSNDIFRMKKVSVEIIKNRIERDSLTCDVHESASMSVMSSIVIMAINKIPLPALLVHEDINGKQSLAQNNRILTAITSYINGIYSLDDSIFFPQLSGKKFNELHFKDANALRELEFDVVYMLTHEMSKKQLAEINKFFNLTYNIGEKI